MEHKNLETMTREISDLLFDARVLCETLAASDDLGMHTGTLVDMINKNLKQAFEYTEDCRQIISIPD